MIDRLTKYDVIIQNVTRPGDSIGTQQRPAVKKSFVIPGALRTGLGALLKQKGAEGAVAGSIFLATWRQSGSPGKGSDCPHSDARESGCDSRSQWFLRDLKG